MELKQASNPIDTAGPVKQVAANLFYGWGYNIYRKENQARADDLLVRNKVCEILGQVRGHLAQVERDYRRDHLPAPTREHPLPDAAALANASALARSQQDIEALEVSIRTAPVPEMDRVTQRHRNELDTLNALRDIDTALVGSAFALSREIEALKDGATAGARAAELLAATPLKEACARRAAELSVLKA